MFLGKSISSESMAEDVRNRMTPKMAPLLLFLVVMTAVPRWGSCPPPADETRYQKFLRQHYHRSGMSAKQCSAEMKNRCLGSPCKEKNSFIVSATTNQIQSVCGEGSTPLGGNLRQSTKPFQVFTCTQKGDPIAPPCEYKGSNRSGKIVIGCDGNLPVHFEKVLTRE